MSIVFVALAAAGGRCQRSPDAPQELEIRNARVRSAAAGLNSAAYLQIENLGAGLERLLGAQCAEAKTAELHRIILDEGLHQMRPLSAIEIPPGQSVALTPGGDHIMLIDLHRPLIGGQQVQLQLQFESRTAISIPARVTDDP
ncbi:MAG: copper chaperone PCu(A)C [Leptospirales bacterium]|nr:copper chaperone PCu(A)C [Leptospirales bacterium]